MRDWFIAHLLTLAIEMPITLAFFRLALWVPRHLNWPKAVLLAWAVNLTHPILWLIHPATWPGIIAAEIVITAVEAAAIWLVFRRRVPRPPWNWSHAVVIALAANASSVAIGLLLSTAGII